MADEIHVTDGTVMIPATGTVTETWQALDKARDVSGYDRLDLAVDTPGNGPTQVSIMTSMTLTPDDSAWVVAATLNPTAPATTLDSFTFNKLLAVPDTANGKPLFRYIRWKIVHAPNIASVNISGMARRG